MKLDSIVIASSQSEAILNFGIASSLSSEGTFKGILLSPDAGGVRASSSATSPSHWRTPRNDKIKKLLLGTFIITICSIQIFPSLASEVIETAPVRVIVREHPKTGKPYVSIIPADQADVSDPFARMRGPSSRPDYRMLDPKIKSGQIPYQGPSSDRKKVYILAASLATVGVVGGVGIIAAAPAATGVGASGGVGAYLAGGSAVTAGTVAGAYFATRPDPKKDNFTHESKTHLTETADKENFFSSTDTKV